MPAYVDTSALVKRYVAEVGSAWVRRLLAHPAQYVIYTAALSQVEVISALQRRVREGSLEVTQAERLAHRVTIHFAQRYQVIALTQAIVDQACVGWFCCKNHRESDTRSVRPSPPDYRRPRMDKPPLFKWRHFTGEIILGGVRCYLRYA